VNGTAGEVAFDRDRGEFSLKITPAADGVAVKVVLSSSN
jgi:hypothetical protein